MASGDWPIIVAALSFVGVALACLVGVILLNWRKPPPPRRGFDVTVRPGRASDPD